MNIPVICADCHERREVPLTRLASSLEPACCESCGSGNIDVYEDDPQVQVEGSAVTAGFLGNERVTIDLYFDRDEFPDVEHVLWGTQWPDGVTAQLVKTASKTATSDVGEFAGGGFMQNLLAWLRGHHTDDIPSWFPKRWLTPEEIASGKWSTRGGQSGAYAFGSKTAAFEDDVRGALKGDNWKVPADLVDALDTTGLRSVWQSLNYGEIPPQYFENGMGRGEALRRRARALVTNYLIDNRPKTAGWVEVDGEQRWHPDSITPENICPEDHTKFRCYEGHEPTGSEICEKCKGKFRCAHGHYYRSGKTAGQKTAVDDGATDRCQYCGLPIKDVEDYGWIVYPASRAPSDEPERCFGNAWGHEPAASKSGSKIPISIRAFITDVNDIPVENPNVFDDPKPTMTSDLMRCSNCFHEWKYSTVDPAQPVPLCPNCGSTATTPAGANGVAAVAALRAKVAHKVTEVTIGILSTNPGMPFEAAQHLAEQTVRSYPKMVAQA